MVASVPVNSARSVLLVNAKPVVKKISKNAMGDARISRQAQRIVDSVEYVVPKSRPAEVESAFLCVLPITPSVVAPASTPKTTHVTVEPVVTPVLWDGLAKKVSVIAPVDCSVAEPPAQTLIGMESTVVVVGKLAPKDVLAFVEVVPDAIWEAIAMEVVSNFKQMPNIVVVVALPVPKEAFAKMELVPVVLVKECVTARKVKSAFPIQLVVPIKIAGAVGIV